jgi:hypothetical protein
MPEMDPLYTSSNVQGQSEEGNKPNAVPLANRSGVRAVLSQSHNTLFRERKGISLTQPFPLWKARKEARGGEHLLQPRVGHWRLCYRKPFATPTAHTKRFSSHHGCSPRVWSSGCARSSLRVGIALPRGEYTENRTGCGQASHVVDENIPSNYSSTMFKSCNEFLK